MKTIFGTKQRMAEAYMGTSRVAVTRIDLVPMTVSMVKSVDKDGYDSTQVVFGKGKKHVSKALVGHLKKSTVKSGKIREIAYDAETQVGTTIDPSSVITAGSLVSIQGTAKGKGFAGAVKRWGFAGGPRTHGQSDRLRAPGSIGQGTTPGRVHKGKRMAGRMGSETVTVKNTLCIAVSGNSIWVTGPVPGSLNTLIKLQVTGSQEISAPTFLKGYEPVAPVEEQPSSTPETNSVEETSK